jgi:hypothetical protein
MGSKLVEMEQADPSSPTVIEQQKAAQLLVDMAQLKMVLPFMGCEKSISEAARETGLAVDAMTYRVKRLLSLGIVHEARKQPRKGRAVTHYQAAPAFFIPVTVIPHETIEQLLQKTDAVMYRRIARAMVRELYTAPTDHWGVLVERGPDGMPSLGLVPGSGGWRFDQLLAGDAPALLSSWMPLRLNFADAKELQRELFALLGRYADREGAQTYLLGLAFAPMDE